MYWIRTTRDVRFKTSATSMFKTCLHTFIQIQVQNFLQNIAIILWHCNRTGLQNFVIIPVIYVYSIPLTFYGITWLTSCAVILAYGLLSYLFDISRDMLILTVITCNWFQNLCYMSWKSWVVWKMTFFVYY